MRKTGLACFLAVLFLLMMIFVSCDNDSSPGTDQGDENPSLDESSDDDDAARDGDDDDDDREEYSVSLFPEAINDDDDDSDDYEPPDPSDLVAIFVSPIGFDTNPGTMAQPVRSIGMGVFKAQNQGKVVFVGRGLYNEKVRTRVSLYGGYEEGGWTRDVDAYQTEIKSPTSAAAIVVPDSFTGSLAIDGFTIHSTVTVSGDYGSAEGVRLEGGSITFRHNRMPGIFHFNIPWEWPFDWKTFYTTTLSIGYQVTSAMILDNEIHGLSVFSLMGTSVTDAVTISSGGDNVIMAGNHIVAPYLDSSIGSNATALAAGGSLVLINNIIERPLFCGATAVRTSAELTMIHNTLRAQFDSGSGLLLRGDHALLVNNIIESGTMAAVTIDDTYSDPKLKLIGNNLWSAFDAPILDDGTWEIFNQDDVNGCSWKGCDQAQSNIAVDPMFAGPDNPHLLPGSSCLDAGVDPTPWYYNPIVDYDFEGDVRPFGPGWDMGADERIY